MFISFLLSSFLFFSFFLFGCGFILFVWIFVAVVVILGFSLFFKTKLKSSLDREKGQDLQGLAGGSIKKLMKISLTF